MASPNPSTPAAVLNPNSNPPKRSRQRPTKSCERCRTKKLRCNRAHPCDNCTKGGNDGSGCHYKHGADGEQNAGEPAAKRFRAETPRDLAAQPQYGVQAPMSCPNIVGTFPQQRPLEFRTDAPVLSGSMGSSSHRSSSKTAIPWTSLPVNNVGVAVLGSIDVKGSRSRYITPGDKMEMLKHFEGTKQFIVDSFKDPSMKDTVFELSMYQKTFYPKLKQGVLEGGDALVEMMLKALPDSYRLGILQASYGVSWETVFRVLHITTFDKNCREIVAIRDSGATNLPPHIKDWVLPQILATLCIAVRLDDPKSSGSLRDGISELQIRDNMAMVQKWLDGLHGKALLNTHTLQTRVLLLIARQVNLALASDLWKASGGIVRTAMIMGLHKDPEECLDMPKLEKETRRRLWTTIVELDMQFSLAAGMPAAIVSSNYNMNGLLNVDDKDLAEDMPLYPAAKPHTEWTDEMPQIALAESIKDRLNITNWLGGTLNMERDAPGLLSHARALETILRSLPQQFRPSSRIGISENKQLYKLFTSIMIDVSIRRPLLAIYRTLTLGPQRGRFLEARRGALRSSLALISHLDALDPAIADTKTVKSRNYLNLFHILCKTDIIQAALIICYEIQSLNNPLNSPVSGSGGADDIAPEEQFPHTKHSLTRVVENVLNSLMQRLGEFGSDLKDILPLSIVLQCARADDSPEERKSAMMQGAERVLLACRKILPPIAPELLQRSSEADVDKTTDNRSHTSQTETAGITVSHKPQHPGYAGQQTLEDFNMVLGDDLNFEAFDLGFDFVGWDTGTSWP